MRTGTEERTKMSWKERENIAKSASEFNSYVRFTPHEKNTAISSVCVVEPTEVCPEAIFIALLLTSKLDALCGENLHPYSRRNRRANKDELERKREQNEKRERVQLLCQYPHTKKHRQKRCLCGGTDGGLP